MPGPRRRIPGHGQRQRRIHQRVAQFLRDPLGDMARHEIVLADHHVRAVLLAAAGVDDRSALSRVDGIAHLRPGQVVDPHRARLAMSGQRGEGDGGDQKACSVHRTCPADPKA
jgi:hypothetical protein